MNIDLHIDELILHGFPTTDRARITAAIECELARLLAERGVPAALTQGGITAQLDAGAFHVARDAGVDAIGAQAAQTIYQKLSDSRTVREANL
jgi:hypothetical protein